MSGRKIISEISLRNFRAFKSQRNVPLKRLTFVVGPNSGGKSSLLSSICLLGQSPISAADPLSSKILWTGPLVDLGSFDDAIHQHNSRLSMALKYSTKTLTIQRKKGKRTIVEKFPMETTVGVRAGKSEDGLGEVSFIKLRDVVSEQEVRLTPRRRKNRPAVVVEMLGETREQTFHTRGDIHVGYPGAAAIRHILNEKKGSLKGKMAGWNRIKDSFYGGYAPYGNTLIPWVERVSSGRSGPKRWYAVEQEDQPTFYFYGRPSLFEDISPNMVDSSSDDRRRARARKTGSVLEKALKQLNIAKEISATRLSPYHTGILVKDNKTNVTSNLIDVGFGASQVIPVLRACESHSHGPLVIEQPEIHLHPKAQGEVAELICETSRRRQVVIETHSVHMINRARLQIARGAMRADDVTVLFVDRDKDGSHVTEIPISEGGDFLGDWPGGFFEERYSDTLELAKLRSKQ